MFSKSCEYGIKAVVYVATQSLEGRRVKIGEVAKNINSPEAFTAKILGLLTKNNIINSLTGPYGGFGIETHSMKQLRISDIIYTIDGKDLFTKCVLGLHDCSNVNPCPIHHKIINARNSIKGTIEKTTLYEMATKIRAGETVLVR